ncbi:MAG: sodium/solute symporter [Acidobacteria bacterium]|nr:sodium/solute symporter [Acidobacteriota bacterium]MBI3654860.1 sodium/solute symporter [Acidobacteriota bacterium]
MGFANLDYFLLIFYFIGITAFGAWLGRGQTSIRDYFLAGRTVPWWAIAFSIVATETSTLTIISTPGIAFGSNMTFLQLMIGYVIGRIIISFLFLPYYFKGELYTAYELLNQRFGSRTKNFTSGLFLVTRALAEGVRVFAISIIVSLIVKTNPLYSIVLVSLITLFYTFVGGMHAVIWTDVIQMVIYIGGTLVAFFQLLHQIPGGWETVTAVAGPKFAIFDFSPNLLTAYTFWAGLLGGIFITGASHGTDQLIVQRLFAARSERDGKMALITSGFVVLFQFTLFLLIGIMLYVYYRTFPPSVPFSSPDRIFPTYIITAMPTGISGLVIAAIFAAAMSNLSSALNSLASTTLIDFYKPLLRPTATDAHYLKVSRGMTIAWGLVLIALAVLASSTKHVLETGLTISSLTWGCMLGIFLLAFLTKDLDEFSGLIGMSAGLAGIGYCFLRALVFKDPVIAWTWYALVGTVVTVVVGVGTHQIRRSS